MALINPVTAASRRHSMVLAKRIVRRFPNYYGSAPIPLVALQVREFLRFCEDNEIWAPDDLTTIITAIFAPSPYILRTEDLDYAVLILGNTKASSEARAKSIALTLNDTGGHVTT